MTILFISNGEIRVREFSSRIVHKKRDSHKVKNKVTIDVTRDKKKVRKRRGKEDRQCHSHVDLECLF